MKRKKKRRWLSAVMTGAAANILAIAVQPSVCMAVDYDTGKAVQIGRGGIEDRDYLYYGRFKGNPVKWRVLNKRRTNTGDSGMFLLSEYLLEPIPYTKQSINGDWTGLNKWENSYAKVWCRDFEQSSFEPGEREAVLTTTDSYLLKDDRLFFPDYYELTRDYYGFSASKGEDISRMAYYEGGNDPKLWWMRTALQGGLVGDANIGIVLPTGMLSGTTIWDDYIYARPAFNFDPDTISFISGPDACIPDGLSDPVILEEVPAYWGTENKGEWKLTLRDDSRSGFQASADNAEAALKGYTDWKVDISYSGAIPGDQEYVSVMLCNNNWEGVLYYGYIAHDSKSGTQTVRLPNGLEPGKYTLKVFSEQWNGNRETGYASGFVDIPLEVQNTPIQKLIQPDAVFEAAGDSQGTLSDVTIGMKYSVDGGNTWKEVTGESMEIVDVTKDLDVRVYQPGDGFRTLDSDIQTIDVMQAEKPEGLMGIACTTEAQNDGIITGVNDSMEYMPSLSARAVKGWIPVKGSEIEGLSAGTYYVRVKANGRALASPIQAVTIAEYREEHVCAGAGEWHSDGTYHWKLCICGAKVEEGVHVGGIASCTEKAECEICQEAYGETGEHSLGDWIKERPADCSNEGTLGHYHCSFCGANFDEEKRALNTVIVSRDPDRHTGGVEIREFKEANCAEEGYTGDTYCLGCGEELTKGSVIPAKKSHEFGEWKVTEEATFSQTGRRERVCAVCGFVESEEVPMVSGKDDSEKEQVKTEESGSRKQGAPKTGDLVRKDFWIELLFLSGFICAWTVCYRKRTGCKDTH